MVLSSSLRRATFHSDLIFRAFSVAGYLQSSHPWTVSSSVRRGQQREFGSSSRLYFRGTEYLQLDDPDLTESQKTVREAIAKICSKFPDEYWLDVDNKKKWPIEFTTAIAKDGWLGICMPEKYGGSNLGLAEATIMMQTVSESGGGNA